MTTVLIHCNPPSPFKIAGSATEAISMNFYSASYDSRRDALNNVKCKSKAEEKKIIKNKIDVEKNVLKTEPH